MQYGAGYYFVAANRGARIRASDRFLLDPFGFSVTAGATPTVAFNGTSWLVAYLDDRITASSGAGQVSAGRVRAYDGAVLDGTDSGGGILLSRTARTESGPSVACAGDQCLVLWAEERPGDLPLARAARIRASDGAMLDGAGITLGVGIPMAVAADGTSYVAVWSDSINQQQLALSQVRASDGALMNPAPVHPNGTAGARDAATASGNGMFLVVFEKQGDPSPNPTPDSIRALRIRTSDLTALDSTAVTVNENPNTPQAPAASFDGTNFLVLWRDRRSVNGNDIYAARLRASDGQLLDGPPQGGGIPIALNVPLYTARSVAAFDGANYLIVWNTPGSGGVYGNRFRPSDGALLDGTPASGGIRISTLPGSQSQHASPSGPGVSFNGTNDLVSWALPVEYARDTDVRGARVRPDGVLLDGPPSAGGFVIAGSPEEEDEPAVASLPALGRTAVVYTRRMADAPYETTRVRTRFVGEAVNCTRPSDCAVGFCVDGVCCDTACGGGATNDCMACSLAAGGTRDGSCTAVRGGQVCKAAAPDVCALAASCDGASTTCPAPAAAPAGTTCRPAVDVCDRPELCVGSVPYCPPDEFEYGNRLCRPTRNACDKPEYCTGRGVACPSWMLRAMQEAWTRAWMLRAMQEAWTRAMMPQLATRAAARTRASFMTQELCSKPPPSRTPPFAPKHRARATPERSSSRPAGVTVARGAGQSVNRGSGLSRSYSPRLRQRGDGAYSAAVLGRGSSAPRADYFQMAAPRQTATLGRINSRTLATKPLRSSTSFSTHTPIRSVSCSRRIGRVRPPPDEILAASSDIAR